MSVLNRPRRRGEIDGGGQLTIFSMETGPSRQSQVQWIQEGHFPVDHVHPAGGRQFERDKNRSLQDLYHGKH